MGKTEKMPTHNLNLEMGVARAEHSGKNAFLHVL